MEVTCERCSTVYDFDDALVSERGTTVKCTTCGHEFRVRRAIPTTSPDVWTVRTVDGREFEFLALRELQLAIHDTRVKRDDVLVRGNSRPRRLASIAELEPFFNQVAAAASGGSGPTPQRARVRGPFPSSPGRNEASIVIPLPGGLRQRPPQQDDDDEPTGTVERISSLPAPPRRPRKTSVAPPAPPAASPAREAPARMFPPDSTAEPPAPAKETSPRTADEAAPMSLEDPTLMMDRTPDSTSDGETLMMQRPPLIAPKKERSDKPSSAKDGGRPAVAQAPRVEISAEAKAPSESPAASDPVQPSSAATSEPEAMSPKPAPSVPASKPSDDSNLPSTSAVASSSDGALSDPGLSGPTRSRRAGAGRWIVGFILVGCAALAAVTLGPKLLSKTAPVTTQGDGRVDALIDEGDRAIHAGDLDGANEAYVKASALADKDGRIALGRARLAAIRADVPWLKIRILSESDPDYGGAKRELELAAERARQAADRANALLPNDANVTRCRIDVLRLSGDLAGARKLVAGLPAASGASNDDLLFATLDLAEASPNWATVIERLSKAARSEQNLGRARSMLIYALAQSGDVARARKELDLLSALPRPHPLLGTFRAFIAEAEKKGPSNASGASNGTDALSRAVEAINKGQLAQATTLLQDLSAKTPNDPKVLVASGDLARKKGDRAAAMQAYEKAMAADKDNFAAIVALADLRWDAGERRVASILYRQIIERGGADNPFMAHAKARFATFTTNEIRNDNFGVGPPAPAPAPAPPPQTPPSPAPAPE